jgi:hypothetical protein
MKCKACNSDLNEKAHVRKDTQGVFLDLCDGCYTVSQDTIYDDVYMTELEGEDPEPMNIAQLQRLWSQTVARLDMWERWKDGVFEQGTRRAFNLEEECFRRFMQLVEGGMAPLRAAETACGIIHKETV